MSSYRAHLCLQALLTSTLLASGLALGDAPITSAPPAASRAPALDKSAAAHLVLPVGAPSLRIALAAPSVAERGVVKAQNLAAQANARMDGGKGRPLAIGFGRPLEASAQTIALETLPWQSLADGTRVARIEINSPDAAALRVALRLPATDTDLSIRFSGSADSAQVFGPIPANTVAEDTARFGVFLSPVLEGDVALIEFEARPGVKMDGLTLNIPRVSHQLLSGDSLRQAGAKRVADIGASLPCEIDVKCVSPQSTAFVNATKAVASIVFSDEFGGLYLCTGTLLNDASSSGTPYFFTANHCIESATSARTINAYWFFDAVSCGSHAVPSYILQASGGTLLARSPDWDWALVRLNAAPPAGAFFSAWRAEPVASGTILTVIHHPEGDLKKFSQGNAAGFVPDMLYDRPTPATFLHMTYTQGQTEGGSSGSGVLSTSANGAFYELRGGLYGGDNPACPRPAGYTDNYSRLDNMLPLTRQYLTPGNNPAGTVVAVEFFNRMLQHYFISTAPGEINDLDTGVHAGWERTGLRFLAYDSAIAGASPVCRFYRAPAYGDSHFYSASPSECASTAAQHPVDWIYESPNVFYIALPDPTTGACAAGTLPIWRFFNQLTTNHRYTADTKTRNEMRDQPSTWMAEGYGPDAVIMCTPAGS